MCGTLVFITPEGRDYGGGVIGAGFLEGSDLGLVVRIYYGRSEKGERSDLGLGVRIY